MADLVTKFTEVTNCKAETALSYLSKYEWDFEEALNHFFEDGGNENLDFKLTSLEKTTKPAAKEGQSSSKIKTFNTLRHSSDEDDDEDKQAFYAGGSDKSGQLILGPSSDPFHNKKQPDKVIEDLFKTALNHGATQITPETLRKAFQSQFQQTEKSSKPKPFSGQGYVLGDNANVANQNDGKSQESKPSNLTNEDELGNRRNSLLTNKFIILKLWKDGYTIHLPSSCHLAPNDPFASTNLRLYTVPENQTFLNTLMRGEIPPELVSRINQAPDMLVSNNSNFNNTNTSENNEKNNNKSRSSQHHINMVMEDYKTVTYEQGRILNLTSTTNDMNNMERGNTSINNSQFTMFNPQGGTSNSANNVSAFSGQGYMLGSPSPDIKDFPDTSQSTLNNNGNAGGGILKKSASDYNNSSQTFSFMPQNASSGGKGSLSKNSDILEVEGLNENEPSTIIQFRVPDGTKISFKCNLTHTIGDLRRAIQSYLPQYETQPFVMLLTFPRQELSDNELTIEGANLMNSVVMIKDGVTQH